MFQIIILFLFISDSFVNSQEWTLSRGVPDIRLGIVGSLSSGKSALVHRYLTGTSLASPDLLRNGLLWYFILFEQFILIRTIYFRTIYFIFVFLGSYMQEESPEGGRFKKEVVVDGQSYLLLIRDEGGPPELQVRILLLRLSNGF